MAARDLVFLAVRYFEHMGYTVERDVLLEGASGIPHIFDLCLRKGDEAHPVYIRDWSRTVGINMVINIDKAAEDVGKGRPIFVASKFSDHARSYSNRRRIQLLTLRELHQR